MLKSRICWLLNFLFGKASGDSEQAFQNGSRYSSYGISLEMGVQKEILVEAGEGLPVDAREITILVSCLRAYSTSRYPYPVALGCQGGRRRGLDQTPG